MSLKAIVLAVGTYTRPEGHVPDGRGAGISLISFDTSIQTMSLLKTFSPSEGGINPSYLAYSSQYHRLYAVNEIANGRVTSTGLPQSLLDVAAATVAPLSQESASTNTTSTCPWVSFAAGGGPCHISVSPSHAAVSVANYNSGSVMIYPLEQSSGALTSSSDNNNAASDPRTFHFTQASHGVPSRQEAPHPHSSLWLNDTALLVADLGGDVLYHLDLNTHTSKVWMSLPSGSGPRKIMMHRPTSLTFVVLELSSEVLLQDAQGHTTTVSTLPPGYNGVNNLAADMALSSDGKFVYVSNRGHDSIACFKLVSKAGLSNDLTTFHLELLGHVSSYGSTPRAILLVDSSYLFVTNQDSHSLVAFSVLASGLLKFIGSLPINSPAVVTLLR